MLLPLLGSFLVLLEPVEDEPRPLTGAADTVLSLAEATALTAAGSGSWHPLSSDGLLPSAAIALARSLAAAKKSHLKFSVTYDRCEVAVLETAAAAAAEPLLPATAWAVCLGVFVLPAPLLDDARSPPLLSPAPAVGGPSLPKVTPSGVYWLAEFIAGLFRGTGPELGPVGAERFNTGCDWCGIGAAPPGAPALPGT